MTAHSTLSPPQDDGDAGTSDTADLLMQAAHSALDYMATIDDRPVFPSAEAIDGLKTLQEPMPADPTDPADVLALLHGVASPATVATSGGRFYGFVTGGCLPVALSANWLVGAWDQNASTWTQSPAAAEIETITAAWLRELFGLDEETVLGFVTGATMASFSSLTCARSRLYTNMGWDLEANGLNGAPPLRIVATGEMHPAVLKALRLLGFGTAQIEAIPTDANGAARADACPPLDERTILILQAGNVNTGAFDPFADLLPRAREAGAWSHIDGAFGMWARATPTHRHLAAAAELADSWAVDAHKWLNVPYDSAFYVCRDREAVQTAFGIQAPYLIRGSRREPSLLTPELSRRARGTEIWAALKSLGRHGVADLISRSCAHARTFARELSAAGFEVLNDVVLNQVCLRYRDDDATLRLIESVQREGTCWVGPTKWQGKRAMRISVTNWAITEEDVAASIAAIIAAARRVGG